MQRTTIVFDVNETLSDMTPMARRFSDVGAPEGWAKLWFAHVLRDGFALAAAGDQAAFADIAADVLGGLFNSVALDCDTEAAVQHVMQGFSGLDVHEDVADGIRALAHAGFRLATLSNGSVSVAEKLLHAAGLRGEFEALLSVEDAPAWKPAAAAYAYAAGVCSVEPAQLLLVAVHPWDIHGAARAGLATAWLNRAGARYPEHFRAPDYTVSSLRELPGELAHGL